MAHGAPRMVSMGVISARGTPKINLFAANLIQCNEDGKGEPDGKNIAPSKSA
jgi:hypothetical protein